MHSSKKPRAACRSAGGFLRLSANLPLLLVLIQTLFPFLTRGFRCITRGRSLPLRQAQGRLLTGSGCAVMTMCFLDCSLPTNLAVTRKDEARHVEPVETSLCLRGAVVGITARGREKTIRSHCCPVRCLHEPLPYKNADAAALIRPPATLSQRARA